MRHRNHSNRLIQKPDHGRMLQRNLVTSILLYESVRTTRRRAKVVQPIIDGLITTAKKTSPQAAIRSINAFVTDRNASRKIMEVLKDRYKTRPSGFTRIKAVGARKGDGAELVDLELVDAVVASSTAVAKQKPAKKPSTAS